MFKTITDPKSGKIFNIDSLRGKTILKSYLDTFHQNNLKKTLHKGGAVVTVPTAPVIASSAPTASIPLPIAVAKPIPVHTNILLPSIQINIPSTVSPLYNYFESLTNYQNLPNCTKKQLKEIEILLDSINKKLVSDKGGLGHGKKITKMKNKLDKLKTLSSSKLFKALIKDIENVYTVSPELETTHDNYKTAESNLKTKDKHLSKLPAEIAELKKRIAIKEKVTSGNSGLDVEANQVATFEIELSNGSEKEKKLLKSTEEKLITILGNEFQKAIEAEKRKSSKLNKKIYISGNINNIKCRESKSKIEFLNLNLIYGNSPNDPTGKKINIELNSVSNSYLIDVNLVNSLHISPPFKIMVPRSIFILDLESIFNTEDPELIYILDSFTNISENYRSNINYMYETFVNYILNFIDNLNKVKKNSIIPFYIESSHKIIGLLDDTFIIDEENKEKNYLLVKIFNFDKFSDAYDEDNITTDINIAKIPPYNSRNITITNLDVSINEFSKSSENYKKYGDLNILTEQRKIIESYALGLSSGGFCTIL